MSLEAVFGGGMVEQQAQHQKSVHGGTSDVSVVDAKVSESNNSRPAERVGSRQTAQAGAPAHRALSANLQPALTGAQLRFVGLWLLAALIVIGGYFTLTREGAGKLRSATGISAPQPLSTAHASAAAGETSTADAGAQSAAADSGAQPTPTGHAEVSAAAAGATPTSALVATVDSTDDVAQQVRKLDAALNAVPVAANPAGVPASAVPAPAPVRVQPSTPADPAAAVPKHAARAANPSVTRGVRVSCGDALASGSLSDSMSAEEQERARRACR